MLLSDATLTAPCEPACARPARKLSAADLPLCCPLPKECLWNAHPRVYLALDKEGHTQCPYCGTRYELDPQATGDDQNIQ